MEFRDWIGENMGCGIDDKWLQEKIDDDIIAMADEREKQLIKMHELENIQMPREKLEEIYREAERRRKKIRKKRIRYRMVAALAAVLVLCVGAGVISSGNKVYVPEIFQSSRGDEVQTKIENSDSIYSEYDEEEVCQEVENKLGVLPVRFGYRSNGMYLLEYQISENVNEAILKYKLEDNELQIYISKDYRDSTISNQSDGTNLNTIVVESCGISIPVNIIDDSEGGEFYTTSFVYLNTYYSINGMMSKEDFIKILENIIIKNV